MDRGPCPPASAALSHQHIGADLQGSLGLRHTKKGPVAPAPMTAAQARARRKSLAGPKLSRDGPQTTAQGPAHAQAQPIPRHTKKGPVAPAPMTAAQARARRKSLAGPKLSREVRASRVGISTDPVRKQAKFAEVRPFRLPACFPDAQGTVRRPNSGSKRPVCWSGPAGSASAPIPFESRPNSPRCGRFDYPPAFRTITPFRPASTIGSRGRSGPSRISPAAAQLARDRRTLRLPPTCGQRLADQGSRSPRFVPRALSARGVEADHRGFRPLPRSWPAIAPS